MTQPAIPARYGPREAQPLDAMLGQAGAADFDVYERALGTDKDAIKPPPLDEVSAEAARSAARLFATEDGRRVVEFLADVSVRRPVLFHGIPDPALYAMMREGQNGLFYTLLKLIAAGREETPPTREGA